MSRRNIYLFMFSVGISIISYIFIKNRYLMFLISLVFLSTTNDKNCKKISLITFFLIVFNSFCGKLLAFCKILLFFDTFLWITRDLAKKDIMYLLGNFFNNNYFKKVLITFFYYPSLFKRNLKIVNYYGKNEGALYKYKKCFKKTNDSLNDIILEFEERLFFYKIKKFNFKVYYIDVINVSVILLIFMLSITL